ncbi:MAG TPA: DUF2071 domain-containing protein, partial [Parachlamydiaceae bacterium]|nr:DUF2071 domain-containing protein [Nitrosopumilus sp.]HEV8052935.1 DUF2071 domain-containing protein [Parachlamydiaceae bacterium]
PYYFADLKIINEEDKIQIRGKREGDKNVKMQFSYQPEEKQYVAEENSLDFFLIERYALFVFDLNQLYIQRIHHLPYSLSKSTLLNYESDLFEINLLDSPLIKPYHICYSRDLKVNFFPLKKDLILA